MKKSTKQIISGIIIFLVTAVTGFIITAVSFNLFEVMTQNQMRLVFAIDVIILLAVGTVSWFIYESKSAQKERKKQKSKNRQNRIDELKRSNEEILNLINCTNFAA